jgi:hypothetical protein
VDDFNDKTLKKETLMLSFILSLVFLPLTYAQFKVESDWITKKKYDYRYVTNYEVKTIKRPLKNFPWIEEDCHDQGNRFANWSKSMSYDIVYSGSLSFSLLGFLDIDLGKEKSKTVEFTFQRWVTPTEGIKARHVLHEEFEIWEGQTQVQYRYGNVIEIGNKTYPFKLEKVNYGISVVRVNVEECIKE